MAKPSERWIEASEVVPMFPTLLWKIRLKPELREGIDEKILGALEALRRGLPRLESGRGWQSEQALHEREEFGDLVACVNDATRSVLRFQSSRAAPLMWFLSYAAVSSSTSTRTTLGSSRCASTQSASTSTSPAGIGGRSAVLQVRSAPIVNLH